MAADARRGCRGRVQDNQPVKVGEALRREAKYDGFFVLPERVGRAAIAGVG